MRGLLASTAPIRLALLCVVAWAFAAAPADGRDLPPGFVDHTILEGLQQPTSVVVAKDGTYFVAEKRGTIVSFSDRDDTTPTRVGDLRAEVHSFDERGLTGIEVDPNFPKQPYVYAAYTYNAPPGQIAPVWGVKSRGEGEGCLGGLPDLAYKRGCVVSSRVSRLTLGKHGRSVSEEVLLADWCQQFGSHSIGELAFDRSGALLVGGGEGAYFDGPDTGDRGKPGHVCGDPQDEGGALRAQDLRTPGDPVSLDGTVARINPLDGSPAFGNPSAVPGNEGRIVAYGLRNPFRFALRPDSDEIWIGDVGWVSDEEVNVATLDRQTDFGWPCFEGNGRQPRYTALQVPICANLNPKTDVKDPFLSYPHGGHVVAGEDCEPTDAAAITGVEFDRGPHFPFPYDGALLFSDFIRGCIWSIGPGRFGRPDHRALGLFETGAATPIDLTSSPGGIVYVDIAGGTIHELSYRKPTSELRLRTQPADLRLSLGERVEHDGTPVTVRTGASVRLSAPHLQVRHDRVFEFSRWSDGGPRSRAFRVDRSGSVTAIYTCRKNCRS